MIGQTPEGHPQPHISIVSPSSWQYLGLAALTGPNKLAYAMRYGFGCHFVRMFERDYKQWGIRQAHMLNILPLTDWLWYLGADTVITNMTIDARQFCDPQYHAVIGMDVNGINNDSFFIRNCPESYRFLEAVLKCLPTHPHDQAAMTHLLSDLPWFRMKYVCQRQFNSYLYSSRPEYSPYSDALKAERGGSWQHGDFVVHFAGIDLPSRILLAKQYLNAVTE